MLALDRSLGVVSDLALYGDHADPGRVYYVPIRPQVARAASGSDLAFLKFRGGDAGEGGAGFLSFVTELAASDEQLEQAEDHLTRQGLAEPVLVQVPWLSGKAFFAAALEEGDRFVEKLLGEVKPDLIGNNRAVFSMMLTGEGARLVESLLALEGSNPLGVRYELEYAGLRPAFDVRLEADYKRIYDELSFGFEVGVAYEGVGVRAGVESATQKLVEAGAIRVEVLHFTDSAELQSRVDQAVRWFQDRLLEDFFKSSLRPPAQKSLLDRALEAAVQLGAATLKDALADAGIAQRLAEMLGISPAVLKSLERMSEGGGQTGTGGAQSTFALKLQLTFRKIHQEELKTITLDWSEARAERRIAAPQGLLNRIGPAAEIVEAESTGDFWDRLIVNVRPLGDFSGIGVERLIVQIAYPEENDPETQQAFVFTPESSSDEPKKFAAWTGGQSPRYRTRSEVHFREDGPWPGEPVYRGPWRTEESLELAVHPLSGVPRLEVEISPGTLDFTEVPQVQVDLRMGGEMLATHMLTAANPTARFRRRLDPLDGTESSVPQLEARPTWFLPSGGSVAGEWRAVEGTVFLVHGPWRSQRTVRLFPVLPEDFIEALVTLTLNEGSRTQTAEVRFVSGERGTRTVVLNALGEHPPPARVEILVIRGDGSTFIGQPREIEDPILLIRDREGEQRQVRVRLLAGTRLADHGLMAVQVQLLDASNQAVDSVVFTESQREPAILLVPVAEGGDTQLRFRILRYALDGSASEELREPASLGDLLVPAVLSG